MVVETSALLLYLEVFAGLETRVLYVYLWEADDGMEAIY